MNEQQTFWDHLDELRSVIIRMLVAVVVLSAVAFCFKDLLFAVILAPEQSSFITYRWFGSALSWMRDSLGWAWLDEAVKEIEFSVPLINTELAQQFIIHMKAAFYAGILVCSPYLLYELFRYISPALYQNERKYMVRLVAGGYLMFLLGVIFSYFILFPFTFRFLGTYQVDTSVVNTITIESYMSTMIAMTIAMGLIFEMPVMSWILAKMRLLKAEYMSRYRRHVIVVILIVAAIITPTSDAFTLMVVSLPMWLLFEVSILIVRKANRSNNKENNE